MTKFLKDSMRWLPGAVVSLGLIAAILYFVDFRKMAASISHANYWLLAAAIVLSFLFMVVRAIVWRTLLRERASYKEVFFTLGEGYLLNNFLPFRLGEFGRAFLLSRKTDLQFLEILPTIVIERAVDLAFSAAILLAALPFVVGAQGSEKIGIIVGIIVVIGLVALYVLARNRQWALDSFHKLSLRWPVLQRFGGSFLEAFLDGLAVLTDGWLFARFLFWMTVNWGISILTFYVLVLAYFPQAQVAWGMFALGAAAFGGAIPSLPGAVGTYDGAITAALFVLTGDQSTSLAVALTSHLYNYLNSGVIGIIGLMREGQTLSAIYRDLMNFRNKKE